MKKGENFKRPVVEHQCTNICIIWISEGEERKQGIENIFEEIMTENFPNLVKEIDIQVQEVKRVPNKRNPNIPTLRHIIIKMQKDGDKENPKSSKRK